MRADLRFCTEADRSSSSSSSGLPGMGSEDEFGREEQGRFPFGVSASAVFDLKEDNLTLNFNCTIMNGLTASD
jgi:hypothetical protein